MAQEVRHLMVGFEGLYEHTNLAELEEEAGEHLIGILGKDWKWGTDKEGVRIRKFVDRPGKYYPITFSTFQALGSKRGIKLRKELKDYFGLLWAEECLTGDTLVPTSSGLIRLDKMVEDTSVNQDISVNVGTRLGTSEAVRWVTKGEQPVLRITTKLGNSVSATYDHKMLKLNPCTYELEWVAAESLKENDLLCVPRLQQTRTDLLSLALDLPKSEKRDILPPQVMTPDLAFVLACIVAEGGIYQDNRIEITNTDVDLISAYMEKVKATFGLEAKKHLQYPAGSKVSIRGKTFQSSKDCYVVTLCSKTVGDWLKTLGVSTCLAPKKTIPWSILQADEQSQLAFLAGYLECDGFVTQTGYLGFSSASRLLLVELQAMLFALGASSSEIKKPEKSRENFYIRVSGSDSRILYPRISPWMVTKALPTISFRNSKLYGIPTTGLINLFQDRKVPNLRKCTFLNDESDFVQVGGIAREILHPATCGGGQKILPYEALREGKYNKLLDQARLVSPSLVGRIETLMSLEYRYVPVASIEEGGVQKVYDITLKDTENRSFIANGLISSNCHHESAPTFHAATKSFNAKYRGGQTATPSRKDQTHLAIFDTLGPVTARGFKEQMTPIVFFHATNIHVPDSTFKGKYMMPVLVNYLARNAFYQDILYEEVLKECEEGRKILVVTERVKQAQRLQQKLKIQGFGCELMIGGQRPKEQNWYAEQLMSGKLSCIIGTQVINENVNIPPWDSIHQPFPNFSKEREEQRVGRIRRPLTSSNRAYLEENKIDWDKPQPRVHIYTWYASHTLAASSVRFRETLYKKWGFDFNAPMEELPKKKIPKTMKDWLAEELKDEK